MRSRFSSVSLALFACLAVGRASGQPPALYSQAPEHFTTASHVVSTDVFNWFESGAGQLSGPWQPLEGRAAWDGSVSFWEDQIKQMMSANIDIIYDHLIPEFDQERIRAYPRTEPKGCKHP